MKNLTVVWGICVWTWMISYGSCGKYEFYMARIKNTEPVLIFDVISGKLNSASSCNDKNNKKQKYIMKVKYFGLIVLLNLTISTAALLMLMLIIIAETAL